MPLDNLGIVALDPGVLLRCAQPDEKGIADLSRGTPPVAFYRLSHPDEGMPMAREVELAEARGARVIHNPRLGSGLNPSVEDLKAVASDINDLFQAGGTVVVHCLAGRERTGVACAAWRLLYGGGSLADVEADLAAYGVTGARALVDSPLVGAVRDLAKELGK